jgi:hypothetical protein
VAFAIRPPTRPALRDEKFAVRSNCSKAEQKYQSAALAPAANGRVVGTAHKGTRFMALTAIAASDAAIAVFDAKYHYEFWRPITAIR